MRKKLQLYAVNLHSEGDAVMRYYGKGESDAEMNAISYV